MEKLEVRLDQVVCRVVRDIQPGYPATRVTFGELPIIEADPAVVHGVLSNVIGAAFRFSTLAPQPAVEISIDASGALQVIDNGPGARDGFTFSFED